MSRVLLAALVLLAGLATPDLVCAEHAKGAAGAAAGLRDDDGSQVPLPRHSRPALSRITAPDPPPPRS
jgi:hypothetical protein